MIGLELPMNKIKGKNTNYRRLIPNEVYTFMEKQRWINDYGEDLVVEDEGIGEDDDYF